MPDSKESSISALQNMDVDNSIAKKEARGVYYAAD